MAEKMLEGPLMNWPWKLHLPNNVAMKLTSSDREFSVIGQALHIDGNKLRVHCGRFDTTI